MIIVHEMSQHYGIQCSLCKLDAVKPLIAILLFKNNYKVKYLASETLQNIAKLRRGRKLIRLSGGIKTIVRMESIFDPCRSHVIPNHTTIGYWSYIIIKTTIDVNVHLKVQMMNVSKHVLPMNLNSMNEINRAAVGLMNCCSGTLRQLCRSLKCQEQLW